MPGFSSACSKSVFIGLEKSNLVMAVLWRSMMVSGLCSGEGPQVCSISAWPLNAMPLVASSFCQLSLNPIVVVSSYNPAASSATVSAANSALRGWSGARNVSLRCRIGGFGSRL